MEKYSIEWKRARGAWVQDHINTDTTGSPCRVWKLHYIQHDTEYSRGEYRTKKEATTELSAYKAARALGSMTSPAKQASSRANGKRGGRPRFGFKNFAEAIERDCPLGHAPANPRIIFNPETGFSVRSALSELRDGDVVALSDYEPYGVSMADFRAARRNITG